LFEAAAQLGAVVAGGDAFTEGALGRHGMDPGTAFQPIDDVLDFFRRLVAFGQNIGGHLPGGKTTLPPIPPLRGGCSPDVALIRSALRDGGLKDFEAVLAALTRSDALGYARRCAEADSTQAAACLDALPDSRAKRTLLELSAFAVTRNF